MENDITIEDTMDTGTIKSKLASFQKDIFEDIKILGEEIVNDEFDYIKKTIETKHGNKYSVIINKTKDGWIIFPDRADIAILNEFQISFPVWRSLYAAYKAKEGSSLL